MEYGHRRLTVPGQGVRLAADRWAPPLRTRRGTVLLLHGGGQTRHSWRHTGRRLAALLVRGRQSRVVSTAGAQELLSLVPSARLVDVDGAGHMVAGDDNDVFGEHLLDFLDGPVRLAG
jgi:pimeloyl-ACP methyl ester carboxylesterase